MQVKNYYWEYNDRPNLIIVRCGEDSLHTNWIETNSSYNIVLIPYADINPVNKGNCFVTDKVFGQKWAPIYSFIVNNIDFVMKHQYIWIPDDDLYMDRDLLESFFKASRMDQVIMAQPALSLNNNYSHVITLSFPNIYARSVSFVEIMAPLFSREALLSCLWTFNLNSTGWGLEEIWFKILQSKSDAVTEKIRIYDAFSMTHTRPLGGQDRGDGILGDKSPAKDKYKLHNDWNLRPMRRIYSIELRNSDLSCTIYEAKDKLIFNEVIAESLAIISKKLDRQFRRKIGGAQGKELTNSFTENKYLLLQFLLFPFRVVKRFADKYLTP